jgi:hypothetical protein
MAPHQQQLPLHFKNENQVHYEFEEKNHHTKQEREITNMLRTLCHTKTYTTRSDNVKLIN